VTEGDRDLDLVGVEDRDQDLTIVRKDLRDQDQGAETGLVVRDRGPDLAEVRVLRKDLTGLVDLVHPAGLHLVLDRQVIKLI